MIRHPDDDSMKKILWNLNETFGSRKGHPMRVSDRHPGLFQTPNYSFLYEKDIEGQPVSFLATQPIFLRINGDTVKLCRVGYVHTHEAHRNNGFVSSLLRHVMDHLEEKGCRGAILWTDQGSFYQRLEWECVDPGIFVSCAGTRLVKGTRGDFDGVTYTTDWDLIEGFRKTFSSSLITHRTHLSVSSYEVKPSPVSKTYCLVGFQGGRLVVYMIYGTRENELYLYEIVGQDEKLRLGLFLRLLQRYSSFKFYLNLHEKDPIVSSLRDYFNIVEVKRQELQMVYGLPLQIKKSLMASTISLIDRL